jgi:hypothetical protein
MTYKRYLWMVVVAWVLHVPAAGTAAQTEGTLEIRVKDHREAIGDFSKLVIVFEEILISPRPGLRFWQTGWKSLTPATPAVDLTRYAGAESATIFRAPVGAGSFDALHLKIKRIEPTLKKIPALPAVKNNVGPIKLGFATTAGGETVIVIDLVVLDLSDHPPRAYELGIRGYEVYTNGKLTDKIPPV